MNVWDPEHVVDRDGATRMLAAQFPALFADLTVDEVEHLADGWDNTVHVVRREWLFRFPRRQMAVPMFDNEVRLLPLLAPRLPLPVPVPELLGEPDDLFPWRFWGAHIVPGIELADAALPEASSPDIRVALGAQVGAFLAALHSPDLAADVRRTPGLELSHDPMRRAQPAVRGPMARETLDAMAARGSWAPGTALDGAIDDLLAESASLSPADSGAGDVPPDQDEVLVHGDLHLRHLLVDTDGHAAGVIDWGDACFADPALDLSLAYAAFAGTSRAALLTAYGQQVSPDRELRARTLAVQLCAALADNADIEGCSALLTESLAGLSRAVSD